jgi:glutaredoxin
MSERATWKTALALAAIVAGVGSAQQWWAGRSDDRLGREVAALAAPGDIRMLSSQDCAACQLARQWLLQHGVAFSECTVERDSDCLAAQQASGAAGTPVLVVRGKAQLGFTPQGLKLALQGVAGPAVARPAGRG